MLADVEEVRIVVAHQERATLRVGDVFLKIDADQRNTDVEVEAMAMAPVPTPEVLWRKPPVLALTACADAARCAAAAMALQAQCYADEPPRRYSASTTPSRYGREGGPATAHRGGHCRPDAPGALAPGPDSAALGLGPVRRPG